MPSGRVSNVSRRPDLRMGDPRRHSLRTVLNAIFYPLPTGCAWRYLPTSWGTLGSPTGPASAGDRLRRGQNGRG